MTKNKGKSSKTQDNAENPDLQRRFNIQVQNSIKINLKINKVVYSFLLKLQSAPLPKQKTL